MTTLQSSTLFINSSSTLHKKKLTPIINAINFPKIHQNLNIPLPINIKSGYKNITSYPIEQATNNDHNDPLILAKMYTILEIVADRIEIHNNVCEQRNNWNTLLLSSVNGIILAATTISATAGGSSDRCWPAAVLYAAATAMLVVMNKVQPSQLAEEQRNATRLFKNLYNQIVTTTLSIGHVMSSDDVTEAMQRVIALDRAYPLPLLGGAMLNKFPAAVAPAVWWLELPRRPLSQLEMNDWNEELEDNMREVIKIIKTKDYEDYIRLSKIALTLNKILAVSGPILTTAAVVGLVSAAPIIGAVFGAMAAAVNAVEHGGQVGMVVEMYRGNLGFFKMVEETIESNLNEKDFERRENGELFEIKVALLLGRSVYELRDVAAKSRSMHEDIDEFASKLF